MEEVIEVEKQSLISCDCEECARFGGPNPRIMSARFSILALQFLTGLVGLVRERSWKALSWLFGGILFFAFVPRRLICCRCEGYGKKCYSFYLGKITSLYLPREEGEVSPLGAGLEALALTVIANAPVVGLRKNKKLLTTYLILSTLTLALQFAHACRHCAENAKDWKRYCPAAKAARYFFNL